VRVNDVRSAAREDEIVLPDVFQVRYPERGKPFGVPVKLDFEVSAFGAEVDVVVGKNLVENVLELGPVGYGCNLLCHGAISPNISVVERTTVASPEVVHEAKL